MRNPANVRSWTLCDAELLCAGQLLYMYGKLDSVDINNLNRRVGREAGELDQAAYSYQLLFDAGCHHVAISPRPVAEALRSFEQWLSGLQAYNPRASDNPTYRSAYATWLPMGRSIQREYERHPAQVDIVRRKSKLADINRLLANGYGLFAEVNGEPGATTRGLIYGRLGDAGYLTYNPGTGNGLMTVADLLDAGSTEDVVAWKVSVR